MSEIAGKYLKVAKIATSECVPSGDLEKQVAIFGDLGDLGAPNRFRAYTAARWVESHGEPRASATGGLVYDSLVRFGHEPFGQEGLLESQTDGRIRLGEDERLVCVKERPAAAVEQVQEVADEADAVEYGKLGSAGRVAQAGRLGLDERPGRLVSGGDHQDRQPARVRVIQVLAEEPDDSLGGQRQVVGVAAQLGTNVLDRVVA